MELKKLPHHLQFRKQAVVYLSFCIQQGGNFSLIEKLFQIFSMPRKSKNEKQDFLGSKLSAGNDTVLNSDLEINRRTGRKHV